MRTVLIANRGEIARRVIRSVHALGLRAVAVYSDADADAAHVREADDAVRLGPAPASASYLDVDAVVRAAVDSGADAVHPGYGFLSENAAFARALAAAGIAFIGPGAEALRVMGDKITAKAHVAAAGVPVTPGVAEPSLPDDVLLARAGEVGFPLLIKPSAGGGGQGMLEVRSPGELPAALASARRTASAAFGDDTLFLERLVSSPRHLEVQILADSHGRVFHLGERECSLQRRHQKVIEEAPSPLIAQLDEAPGHAGATLRHRLGEAAVAAARSVGYVGAGTVEFLLSDENPDEFFFMEMNTRLQVEHPVTEEAVRITRPGAAPERIDLVAWQLRIAAGEALDFAQDDVRFAAHAVEARVYAERPEAGFLPAVGAVRHVVLPSGPGVRVDSALDGPGEIGPHYDPLIAKVIASAPTREAALNRLDAALAGTCVAGAGSNVEYLRRLLAHPDVRSGCLDTGLIARFPELARAAPPSELAAAIASAAALRLEIRAGRGEDALAPLAPAPPAGADHAASGTWQPGAGLPGGWEPDGFRAASDPAPVGIRLVDQSGEALDTALVPLRDGASGPAGSLVWTARGRAVRHALANAQELAARLRLPDGTVRRANATLVHTGGPAPEIWVHAGGATLHVSAPLRVERTRLDLAARRERRQTEGRASDPRAVAPMTGTVASLAVADGDEVAVGDTLLSIEAMKMEHAVLAPVAGRVRLDVAAGDQVGRGRVVALIHTETNTTEERA